MQYRLREQANLVETLLQEGAIIYVCGDAANMAGAVHATLAEIIADKRGLSLSQAEEVIKKMRNNGEYQEDVWS